MKVAIQLNYYCIVYLYIVLFVFQVYGYSMGFGKANHARAVEILQTKYKDYKIEWSDEGY